MWVCAAVTGTALGGLPLLLISTVALVADYLPDPVWRAALEAIPPLFGPGTARCAVGMR